MCQLPPKFRINSVKILGATCTSILILFGAFLIIRATTFRQKWGVNIKELGIIFQKPASFCLFFGIATILVGLFGFGSLFIAGYGILIVYKLMLLALTVTSLVYGIGLYNDVFADSETLWNLKGSVMNLGPFGLDRVQYNFRCCGVDKYTDYILFWKYLDANITARLTGSNIFRRASIKTSRAKSVGSMVRLKRQGVPNKIFSARRRHQKIPKSQSSEARAVNRQIDDQDNDFFIPPEENIIQERLKPKPIAPLRADDAASPARIWQGGVPTTLYPIFERGHPLHQQQVEHFRIFGFVFDWFKTLHGWWYGVWDTFTRPLKAAFKGIFHAFGNIYEYVVPEKLKHLISVAVGWINRFVNFLLSPFRKLTRWWFGSGWDYHLFTLLNRGLVDKLPMSCCKNPTRKCYGSPYDTWMFGCKNRLIWYWCSANIELSLMLIGFSVASISTILVLFVLIGGIREKFYF